MSRLSSADTENPVPADPAHQAVVDELSSRLGEAVVGTELRRGDAWVRVDRTAWRRTADTLRELGFDYFCFLSGIDWMPATAPNPEEAGAESSSSPPDTSVSAAASSGFGWLAGIQSIPDRNPK